LERYFNQPYSASFGYQILLALSTDLMGKYNLMRDERTVLMLPKGMDLRAFVERSLYTHPTASFQNL
jgi:hypothetical protein